MNQMSHTVINVWFQKLFLLTSRRVTGNSQQGVKSQQPKLLKECMNQNCQKFPGGERVLKQKNFCGSSIYIFCNTTLQIVTESIGTVPWTGSFFSVIFLDRKLAILNRIIA